jgi:hypothetical protein
MILGPNSVSEIPVLGRSINDYDFLIANALVEASVRLGTGRGPLNRFQAQDMVKQGGASRVWWLGGSGDRYAPG